MGDATQAIKAGATVKGTWLWTVKEILVDINDRVGRPPYVYQATVDAEGNLVIDRGEIYPQGNFNYAGPPQMIFKKVQ